MEQNQHSQIDHLLYQVLRTIFHYERRIAMDYGLDFQHIYALQFLRRHPNARLTEVADELELPKFTVSRLLNRLVDEGFISKDQDQVDRRNYHLRLEDKGEGVLQKIENASYTRISTNIEGLSPAEVHELYEVAELLHKVLGVTEKVKATDETDF